MFEEIEAIDSKIGVDGCKEETKTIIKKITEEKVERKSATKQLYELPENLDELKPAMDELIKQLNGKKTCTGSELLKLFKRTTLADD